MNSRIFGTPVRFWNFWVELFARTETGESLALFRIAIGVLVAWSLLSVWLSGLVELLWLESSAGGLAPTNFSTWLVKLALGIHDSRELWSLFYVTWGMSLLFIAGVGGRWTALLLLQLYYGLIGLNGFASGGFDSLLANGLWLCFLGNSTQTWSVDCRLRNGRWRSDKPISAWPRYLVVFQLVVVYTVAGWCKYDDWWWFDGDFTAIYYILRDTSWIRFDGEFWTQPIPFFVTQVSTAVTLVFERLVPLLLLVFYYRYTAARGGWLRRVCNRVDWRKPFVMVGIALHGGILVLMDVGPFSWVVWAYYLALIQPEELRRWIGALRSRIRADEPSAKSAAVTSAPKCLHS